MSTMNDAAHVNSYVLKMRKLFHMHPELPGQEIETSKRIQSELNAMKVEFEVVDHYSIVAFINRGKHPKSIALRCEMDALPIEEQSDYEFRSLTSNVSHMSGHDIHMAIILGVIKTLKYREKDLTGEVVFIFESNTQKYLGATPILNSGLLDNVNYIFALHNITSLEPGQIGLIDGMQLMGSDVVRLQWYGETILSSYSTLAKDPILAAAHFTDNIQSVVTKSVDPHSIAIIAITKFLAGVAQNIVASHCEMFLNVRYNDIQLRTKIHNIIKEYIANIENRYNVSSKYEIVGSALPVFNDEKAYLMIDNAVNNQELDVQKSDIKHGLESDNFSNYLNKIPGAYALFGARDTSVPHFSNHTDKYFVDESSFKSAVALYLQIVYDYLRK